MFRGSLFDLYRQALAVVVSTYVFVRLASFIVHWHAAMRSAPSGEVMLRRWALTVLLRIRLRRFLLEFAQIGVLLAVLLYLIYLHR